MVVLNQLVVADLGNYRIKSITSYGISEFISAVSSYRNLKGTELLEGSHVVEIENKKYFIGEQARISSRSNAQAKLKHKASNEVKVRALTTVAKHVLESNEQIVHLAVANTIDGYNNAQDIKDMLKGNHTMSIDDKKVTFVIDDVYVLPECASAAFAIADSEKPLHFMIVDVGSTTTNIAIFKFGKYNSAESLTLPFGSYSYTDSYGMVDAESLFEDLYNEITEYIDECDKIFLIGGLAESMIGIFDSNFDIEVDIPHVDVDVENHYQFATVFGMWELMKQRFDLHE